MDDGVDGNAQRINQLTWMLFLKVFDSKEQNEWFLEEDYDAKGPFVEEKYQWSNWAGVRPADRMSSDELIDFVAEMFRSFREMPVDANTDRRKMLVKEVFEDSNNYMKNGVLLWQVIDKINEIQFENYSERHAFNDIYETILKDLQSAGQAGEFYTPRALTTFIIDRLKPQIGESVADLACGTGGFLISSLEYLKANNPDLSTEQNEIIKNSIYGIEKKPMPHLLCCTNLILHDIDEPHIRHMNSLEVDVKDYPEDKKYDIIAMNPPFGGKEEGTIKHRFPAKFRTSETADLFLTLIMYRLKKNGRAAVVIPDGFLFGTDNAKIAIKEKLIKEFNLHTVVRLPPSVFAPYTGISTNVLFFDNTGSTDETWFYRIDMPEGYKHFSKTKPMRIDHFAEVVKWWDEREEINVDGFPKSKRYSPEEIIESNYNLDLCGIPHMEETILPPDELIKQYYNERHLLNNQIDRLLDDISNLLDIEDK